MSAHRPAPSTLATSDLVHLALALCCALTPTPWGPAMAVVVLLVLVARRQARRALERSAAVRRGALTPGATGLARPARHAQRRTHPVPTALR